MTVLQTPSPWGQIAQSIGSMGQGYVQGKMYEEQRQEEQQRYETEQTAKTEVRASNRQMQGVEMFLKMLEISDPNSPLRESGWNMVSLTHPEVTQNMNRDRYMQMPRQYSDEAARAMWSSNVPGAKLKALSQWGVDVKELPPSDTDIREERKRLQGRVDQWVGDIGKQSNTIGAVPHEGSRPLRAEYNEETKQYDPVVPAELEKEGWYPRQYAVKTQEGTIRQWYYVDPAQIDLEDKQKRLLLKEEEFARAVASLAVTDRNGKNRLPEGVDIDWLEDNQVTVEAYADLLLDKRGRVKGGKPLADALSKIYKQIEQGGMPAAEGSATPTGAEAQPKWLSQFDPAARAKLKKAHTEDGLSWQELETRLRDAGYIK